MTLKDQLTDREYNKFEEGPSGEHRVRTTTLFDDSQGPLPVSLDAPQTGTIYNIATPGTANTEFSQALPANTKRFMIRTRGLARLQFCFASGQSNTNFISVPPGTNYTSGEVDLTGSTIFMQSSKASQVVEILAWS